MGRDLIYAVFGDVRDHDSLCRRGRQVHVVITGTVSDQNLATVQLLDCGGVYVCPSHQNGVGVSHFREELCFVDAVTINKAARRPFYDGALRCCIGVTMGQKENRWGSHNLLNPVVTDQVIGRGVWLAGSSSCANRDSRALQA